MKPFRPIILPALVLCACTSTYAQKHKPELPKDTVTPEVILQDLLYRHPPEVENSEEKVFACPIEHQPEFPGGIHAMYKFIQANLHMPKRAKNAGISGRVFLSFMILETGDIKDITVLKGLGFGCDEEAVRVVGLMPRWKPGKRSDKIVRVKYNLPISFFTNQ